MKISKVTISGMHKIGNKSYPVNENITYFIGPNGVGKSTILEAIQLCLLGYIPGYGKQNSDIMKHSSGPTMSVSLTFDDGTSITRSWLKSGSSIQSVFNSETLAKEDVPALLGEVELPVFNFNEFKSMTANKLKDWFITFLPSSSDGVDILAELKESVSTRGIDCNDLLNETSTWIQHNSGLRGIELVRSLNAKFKDDQSYLKGQISKLEGTIQSLVRYDDAEDIDDVAVKTEISELTALKNSVMQYEAQKSVYDRSIAAIEQMKSSLPAERFSDDSRVKPIQDKIEEIQKKNEVLKADYNDLQSQVNQLMSEKMALPKSGNTCPYTNKPCETAAALLAETKAKIEEIDKQIQFKKDEMNECNPSLIAANDREVMKLNSELGGIQAQYNKLASMVVQIDNMAPFDKPTDKTVFEIDEEISVLQNKLVHYEANKRYEELSSTVAKDKFKLENDLEIYKVWAKKTDANGLQTLLMNKPFEDLAEEMSKYLSQMFGTEITAKFNLISKANSFSFGLERDDSYIEFDYLSSGERCLFTLALILCILNKSNGKLKTILIDDILDHLDNSNASYLFNALKQIKDVQFVLAGVKECEDASICKQVEP